MSGGPHTSLFVSPSTPRDARLSGTFRARILTGETVDIPGPAAGFVRVFRDNISITPESGVTPTMPFFLVDAALNTYQPTGWASGAGSTSTVNAVSPIGVGEVWRVGPSPAAASPMIITAPWQDLPAASFTLFRLNLSDVAQDVIAAPAAGLLRRFYRRDTNMFTIDQRGMQIINRDTVSTSLLWTLGGNLIARNAAVAANAMAFPVQPIPAVEVTASTGALQLAAGAAPTTRPLNFVGAYQTLPI